MSCISPNILSVGDTLWCSLYGWDGDSEKYPHTAFMVRIRGFGPQVHVEAVERCDDALVENEWTVPFGWLRRA